MYQKKDCNMKKVKIINAGNIKDFIGIYTISQIVYDYLNTVPKSPNEATKRYNYQKYLRNAIKGKNKPKTAILTVCRMIARDHAYCEKMINKFGIKSSKNWVFDWEAYLTKEEAPMWGNYNDEGKINLEEAMGYMLFNKMKPYLIDNNKTMLFDRCVKK